MDNLVQSLVEPFLQSSRSQILLKHSHGLQGEWNESMLHFHTNTNTNSLMFIQEITLVSVLTQQYHKSRSVYCVRYAYAINQYA